MSIMTLCSRGRRGPTRGWRNAKHVKRATNKLRRRLARAALRSDDGDIKIKLTQGWVW